MKRPISFRSSKTAEGPAASAPRSAGRWPPADGALATQGSWDWLAFARQPQVWPEVLRAARPALLIGVAVLMVSLSAALAAWGTRTPVSPKISLLADTSSPNLNSTSAEKPALPATKTESRETARLEAEQELRDDLKTLEVQLESVTLIPVPESTDDSIRILVSHPGDTPMIQDWKMLGMQTILAGALVAASSSAAQIDGPVADSKDNKGSSDVKKEDPVVEQLKALRLQIEAMNTTIKNDFGTVRNDILEAKTKASTAQKDVDLLKLEVERLRKEIDSLRTQASASRVSNYPASPAGTARIRLVNTFTDPVAIRINERIYHLNQNEERFTDPLTIGDVVYEVLGIQAPRTTKVTASTPLTISVFTKPFQPPS
jgi:hypothetical protein